MARVPKVAHENIFLARGIHYCPSFILPTLPYCVCVCIYIYIYIYIYISKAVPLHAMEALGGERRYSFHSFSTSALDGGEWSASRPGRALPPGKGPPVPIVQEAGWAPEPVWTQRLEEKSLPLPEIEPRSPGRPVRSQPLY
jgi:hypothetical protein